MSVRIGIILYHLHSINVLYCSSFVGNSMAIISKECITKVYYRKGVRMQGIVFDTILEYKIRGI